jgi:peptidoglycan hydrolase-like protein with peptidoglycan-binding domain
MYNYPLFTDSFGGYEYRPFKYDPAKLRIKGWDVYAYQTVLEASGFDLPRYGADGDYGAEGKAATLDAQRFLGGLVVDGIAGNLTQFYLTKYLVGFLESSILAGLRLAPKLLIGVLTHESSLLPGEFTPIYPDTGKRDLGVSQRNELPTFDNFVYTFDAPTQIKFLAKELRGGPDSKRHKGHDDFYGRPGAKTHQRAWELAAGAWNAPSWATTLADGKLLTKDALDRINAYIASTTAYVTSWPA